MKLSLKTIEVPPPGAKTSKGAGWSKVFIHLTDEEIGMYPSVTVETHVPYDDSVSYDAARKAALERARMILKSAAEALDETSLEKIDRKS